MIVMIDVAFVNKRFNPPDNLLNGIISQNKTSFLKIAVCRKLMTILILLVIYYGLRHA